MMRAGEQIRTAHRLHTAKVRSARERSYGLYLVILVCLFIVAPLMAGLITSLVESADLEFLLSPTGHQAMTALCLVTLGVFGAVGVVQGPAVLPAFLATVLLATPIPRSQVLRRPLWTATAWLLLGVLGATFPVSFALSYVGLISPLSMVFILLYAVLFTVLLAAMWLLGQRLGPAHAWLFFVGGAIVATVVWFLPYFGAGGAGLLLVGAAVALVLPWTVVPRILNGLDGQSVIAQGVQRQRAFTAAQTADLSGALAQFRPVPRLGRHYAAVRDLAVPARFFFSDLVGALRTPVRFTTGLAALVGGTAAMASGLTTAGAPATVLFAGGAALGYAGLGVFSDGFRYAAALSFAPQLFRYTTAQLYLLHALLPGALSLITATTVMLSFSPAYGFALWDLVSLLLASIFLTTVRAFDSAKGPMPPVLLSPVYSPGGDLSGIVVALWQFDALLIAVGATALALGAPHGAGLVILIVGSVIIGLLAQRRLTCL